MANVSNALDELERRAEAAEGIERESGDAGFAAAVTAQRELLVSWAEEEGIALEAQEWLARKQETHAEHHVYFDPDKQRYFKITHDSANPDLAGFAVTVDVDVKMSVRSQRWIGVPFIRDATPFEYLSRLALFNRTFSDNIQIEGVICDPGQVAIVTSQPAIRGKPASSEQVRVAMEEMGFILADCPPLGRRDVISLSFFHPEEHIAVFDTHAANFLINDAIVAPIDALIVRPPHELIESLEFYLGLTAAERRKEIGEWTSQRLGL